MDRTYFMFAGSYKMKCKALKKKPDTPRMSIAWSLKPGNKHIPYVCVQLVSQMCTTAAVRGFQALY